MADELIARLRACAEQNKVDADTLEESEWEDAEPPEITYEELGEMSKLMTEAADALAALARSADVPAPAEPVCDVCGYWRTNTIHDFRKGADNYHQFVPAALPALSEARPPQEDEGAPRCYDTDEFIVRRNNELGKGPYLRGLPDGVPLVQIHDEGGVFLTLDDAERIAELLKDAGE